MKKKLNLATMQWEKIWEDRVFKGADLLCPLCGQFRYNMELSGLGSSFASKMGCIFPRGYPG